MENKPISVQEWLIVAHITTKNLKKKLIEITKVLGMHSIIIKIIKANLNDWPTETYFYLFKLAPACNVLPPLAFTSLYFCRRPVICVPYPSIWCKTSRSFAAFSKIIIEIYTNSWLWELRLSFNWNSMYIYFTNPFYLLFTEFDTIFY